MRQEINQFGRKRIDVGATHTKPVAIKDIATQIDGFSQFKLDINRFRTTLCLDYIFTDIFATLDATYCEVFSNQNLVLRAKN